MSTNRSTQKLQRRALRKKKGASVFQYFLLILGTVVILLPMYLTVVTAFKSPEESARNFFAPPTSLYLDNIISVVNKANFFYYIRNSFVITLFSLLGIILIGGCGRNPGPNEVINRRKSRTCIPTKND